MWRRTRWILLALVVLVVGGVVALALVEQPKLDDAEQAVDAKWVVLRAPLDERYQALQDALTAFAAGGGGERSVSKDLGDALSRWSKARAAKDPDAEVAAANDLEAQGSRLLVNARTARFTGNASLTQALDAFDGHLPPQAGVAAYGAAVRRYQHVRESLLGGPIARVLGFRERPTLVLGG